MTPEDARAWFLPFHGTFGVLSMLGGFGALLVLKGSLRHKRLGWVFVVGQALATVVVSPVIAVTQNVFLGGMGAFAAYMTWTGWRIARRKDAPATGMDLGISGGMVLGGVLFAAWGAKALAAGHSLGLVPIFMGLGGALFARSHWRWFRAQPGGRRPWVVMHLGAIGGGLIAALTAFSAAVLSNYATWIPEFVVWLAPAAVLSPLLQREGRRVEGR